jgi:4-hydroxy-tetrahydrodipicolinate synthase
MTHEELRDGLANVAFTTTTPFTPDGASVDREAVGENTAALVEAGAELVIPCGNTGEYYALGRDERVAVVEETVAAVDDDVTVVAGAGGSLPEVTDLASAYVDAGVDGVMLMHPGHTHVHERGALEYYRAVADAVDVGLVVYKRGPEVSDDVVVRLSTEENVVGVKYAVNDVKGFSDVASRAADEFALVNGIAERFAPAFALEGADGFTTGVGNFAPEAALELEAAIEDRDWERARAVRERIRPYEDLRDEPGDGNALPAANNVPAVKFGLELAGRYGGPVRPPLVDLSEADRERAREHYRTMRERAPTEV